MNKDRTHFLLLNIGHFLDHLFTLIFATVSALALISEWNMSYSGLLAYATPGFLAFGLFALPAGWLADKWSRDGMMTVFFIGIGLASILTGFSQTPLQIGIGLFVIGVFAAIYHPVGLAIVTLKWKNTGMRIAMNGVWGNLGVACAALITGFLIDHTGWRMAFVLPGIVSILMGLAYMVLRWDEIKTPKASTGTPARHTVESLPQSVKSMLIRVSIIVFITTALASISFQATTFALPKIFDERMQGLVETIKNAGLIFNFNGTTDTASIVGTLAFLTFAIASIAQLIVGLLLDRFGPKYIFLTLAGSQILFFSLMPGLENLWALAVALGFMLGTFGQIPINDFMIGKMAAGSHRARIYGIRYVVAFSVLALTLPIIAFVHQNWGFDTLFRIMAIAAMIVFAAVSLLPGRLPSAEPQPEAAQ